MLIVPAALLLGAIVVGLIPGAVAGDRARRRALHRPRRLRRLGAARSPRPLPPVPPSHVETFDYLYAAAASLGALGVAALTLFGAPLRDALPRVRGPPRRALTALRQLHSGHIGDYIAWWTAAAAMLGGACLILLT